MKTNFRTDVGGEFQEWNGWTREQYVEVCEQAVEWLRELPEAPYYVDIAGLNVPAQAAKYIARALVYFPMALWAAIQHNNDAAAYWRELEKERARREELEKAVKALQLELNRAREA